jgi:hypothetical protein
MRKIFWTVILLATLSGSLQASAQTMCNAWRKDWDERTKAFNSECVPSSLNYSRRDDCNREAGLLEIERRRILYQCHS